MVKTFNTDENNDIFIGTDGLLSIAEGELGVMKACETATYAQRGEMILTRGLGMPNMETVFAGVQNLSLWREFLRTTLMSVAGVISVKDIQISIEKNVLSYTATIKS